MFSNKELIRTFEDSQPLVPESFCIENGKVYVDDPINGGIAVYKENKKLDSIPIENYSGLVDLDFIGDKLYKLDNKGDLATISDEGKESLVFSYESTIKKTYINKQNVEIANENYPVKIVLDDGLVSLKMDNAQIKRVNNGKISASNPKYEYTIIDNTLKAVDLNTHITYSLNCDYEPIEISELYCDNDYRYFFICEADYQNKNGTQYYKYVYKFSENGQIISVYMLEDAFVYVPNKQVCVEDGDVYQMLILKDEVQILKLKELKIDKFSELKQIKFYRTDESKNIVAEESTLLKAPSNTTIINTLNVGIRLSNLSWTYSKSKNGNINVVPQNQRAYVSQPHYLRNVTGTATVKGYPYCWGGYDSETTASQTGWKNFKDGLSKGKYAGNISGKTVGYKSNTIGLDCSGLISVTYSLGKNMEHRAL